MNHYCIGQKDNNNFLIHGESKKTIQLINWKQDNKILSTIK